MSQITNTNVFQGTHVGQTDMQNIENFLLALLSTFSGASTPSISTPGMWCFDTDASVDGGTGVFYARDASDADWVKALEFTSSDELVASMPFESGVRMLFMNSTAPHGWTRYTGFADGAVVTIADSGFTSGGSGKFETTATWSHTHGNGSLAGPSHIHTMGTHNHQWYHFLEAQYSDPDAHSYDSDGSALDINRGSEEGQGILAGSQDPRLAADYYTANVDPGNTYAGGTGAVTGSTASDGPSTPLWQESICCTKDA